ncbi:hypothetical protein [Gulosibacter sp. 10]|uniref:hypothetical protein n=1 Tax=Gulosibacter sp. 10 TaxID=1255570 RepID=UPI00097F4E41|nr:hypothetical protein [Gulosibacter sp. 10]SJM69640.1 hypothetical protein FM112_14350 [Gulosibacter sp. 10]
MPAKQQPKLIYHLNYHNGEPEVCHEKGCTYLERDHFDTREAASAAYEEHMCAYLFPRFTKERRGQWRVPRPRK